MKIYDCFMFSDEKMVLDIRLNVLSKYIDHFIIVESKYKHNGDVKGKNFNLKDFEKYSVFVFLLNPNRPDSFRPPHRSWLSLVPAPLEDAARQLLQLVSRYVLQL